MLPQKRQTRDDVVKMSLLVKDVMTKNVVTIESAASVTEAAELMNKHDISCLIVMKEAKIAGIVTERDMIKRVLLQCRDPRMTRVSDVMSAPVIASGTETELNDAVRLMNERNIKKLAVVENDSLAGLLSTTDVVRSLAFLEHAVSSLCSRCKLNKNVDVAEIEAHA